MQKFLGDFTMEIITRYDNFLNVIFDIIFDNYGITPIIAIRWDIDCIYMIMEFDHSSFSIYNIVFYLSSCVS